MPYAISELEVRLPPRARKLLACLTERLSAAGHRRASMPACCFLLLSISCADDRGSVPFDLLVGGSAGFFGSHVLMIDDVPQISSPGGSYEVEFRAQSIVPRGDLAFATYALRIEDATGSVVLQADARPDRCGTASLVRENQEYAVNDEVDPAVLRLTCYECVRSGDQSQKICQ